MDMKSLILENKPRGYDNWLINGTSNHYLNEECISYKKMLDELNKL